MHKHKNQRREYMKKLTALASCLGAVVILAGCSSCPTKQYAHHNEQAYHAKKQHHKKQQKMQSGTPQLTETVVFYQTYDVSDIDNVTANMFTRSSRGGESAMGTIKFVETNDGLHMKTDLIDLRPGVTYTAHVYQCGSCNNDSMCCDTSPMSIDLPKLKIEQAGRLQKSYIIRGLTAAQLNNAKLVLTRDGGYKAAWGKLK